MKNHLILILVKEMMNFIILLSLKCSEKSDISMEALQTSAAYQAPTEGTEVKNRHSLWESFVVLSNVGIYIYFTHSGNMVKVWNMIHPF